MLRTVMFTLLAAPLATGCLTNKATDSEVTASRYAHRMGGQACHSWIRSHKTGFLYCASPAFVEAPARTYEFVEELPCPTDEAGLAARGQTTYDNVCAVCHGAEGAGDRAQHYPPLAGAGEYYGEPANHAKIIVHGLNGTITVLGQEYGQAVMAPHGHLSDCDIAAVATYERTSWGNADGMVSPEVVASVR